jgi:hypothetical protein
MGGRGLDFARHFAAGGDLGTQGGFVGRHRFALSEM